MTRTLTSECKNYLYIQELTVAESREEMVALLKSKTTLKGLCFSEAIPTANFTGSVLGELATLSNNSHSGNPTGGRAFSYTELEKYAFHSCTLGIPYRPGARAALATALLLSEQSGSPHEAHELTAHIAAETFQELCEIYGLSYESAEVFFDDNATTALFSLLALLTDKTAQSILSFSDTGRLINPTLKGAHPFQHAANFPAAVDIWDNKRLDTLIRASQHIANSIHTIHTYLPHRATHEQLLEQVHRAVTKQPISLAVIPTITSSGYRVPFIEVAQILRGHSHGEKTILLLDDCQGVGRLNLIDGKGVVDDERDLLWNYYDGVFLTGAKVLGALLGTGAILWQGQRLKQRLLPFEQSSSLQRHRSWSFWSYDLERVDRWNKTATTGGMAQAPELASLLVCLRRLREITSSHWKSSPLATELLNLISRHQRITAYSSRPRDQTQCDSIISFAVPDEQQWLNAKRDLLHKPQLNEEKANHIDRISLPAHLTVHGASIARFALNPLTLYEEPDYASRALVSLERLLALL
jgi:hypothetical protein